MLDIIETDLRLVAMVMIAASIVQIMRASIMVYAAILTVLFLKKKLYRHHLASLITILFGVVLVGIAAYTAPGDSYSVIYSGKDIAIGIILLQVGEFMGAWQHIFEERYLQGCESLDPMIVVGYEGLWGGLVQIIILIIFQNIPCTANSSICANGRIEDSIGIMEDYAANPILIWQSIAMILLGTALNISGVAIIKYGSAVQRTTVDLSKNVLIWIYFMFVPIDVWNPST